MILLEYILLGCFVPPVLPSASDCSVEIVLHNCNRDFENSTQWIWRRDRRYQISSTVQLGCQASHLTYTWTIQKFSTLASDVDEHAEIFTEFNNRPQFILDYYDLGTGLYVLTLTVTNTQNLHEDQDQCLINIRAELPVPVILGGNVRVVPSGKPFIIDGKHSVNYDVKPDQEASLYYKWECVSHTNPDDQFCAQGELSHRNEMVMPSARDGDRLTVFLSVSTEHSPWIQAKQEIIVQDGGYQINIECIRNCRHTINYRSTIYLEAFCDDCPGRNYTWTMKPGKHNKKVHIDWGRETLSSNWKLIIKEEVLVPGDEYQFVVWYGTSYAYEELRIANMPRMEGECSVTPNDGICLETLFQISCPGVIPVAPVRYTLYQNDSGFVVPLSENVDGSFSLHLPSSAKKLFVKIEDPEGLYIIKELSVKVFPANEGIIDRYDESMNQIKASGNIEQLVQLSYITSEEAKTVEQSEVYKTELKKKIIKELNQIPIKTQNDVVQVAAVSRNLWEIETPYDREFEKVSVQLSAKIAENQLKLLQEAPYPSSSHLDVSNAIPSLTWVANQSLSPQFEDIIVDDVVLELTTPEQHLMYPSMVEDYPVYHDADLNYLKKLRDHKETTECAIATLSLVGLSVGMTLLPGEPIYQTNNPNTINVLADSGRVLSKVMVGDYETGFLIAASPSLANETKAIGVIVAYPQNPYWWNAINLSTIVVNANYYNGQHQIINTDKPLQLLLRANWTDPLIFHSTVTVPTSNEWHPKTMDNYIAVHRIDVKQGAALIVHFYNLQENSFDIAFTYNRRPDLADFSNKTSINKTNPWVIFLYPTDLSDFGDAWFYIGVLPNNQMLEDGADNNVSFVYEISFTTPICHYWSNNFEEWISSDCQTGELTNKDRIHCYCTHHSSYAGSYLNPRHKFDPYHEVKFVLQAQDNNLIFACVLTIFLLYCVALICGLKVSVYTDRQVLFLPDNVEEGYSYLVIVKTGSQFFSGTSSNIGLIIYGLEERSKVHLLNYPDPNKKILQRGNEDWFVLTSGKCLGELDYIWLWFDSVGKRPSWYCEWVKIVDVQTGQDWFFDVQALLAVTDDGYCRVAVSPSPKVQKTGWITFLNRHAWNVTQTAIGRLGYQERITVVLSTILTISSFALFLHNPPSLNLSYGLGQGHFSYQPELLALATLCALISFGINRVFFTFFSKSDHYMLIWTGLIATILINLAYLILFGFGNSNVTALMWMVSTLSALVQVVLLEILYTLLNRAQFQEDPPIDLGEVMVDAYRQKHELHETFGASLLRPYFTSKYRALTVEEWKAKREKEMERYRLATLLQDLFMFIIYILLLYLVVLANRDSRIVYGNESMKNLLVSEGFEDIAEIDNIYEYVNESLIPAIHPTRWYGTWTANEPGLMADFNTKILGVARLRQVRVSEACIFSSVFQAEFLCLPEYARGQNDVLAYMEFWEPLTQVAVPRFSDAWRYKVDGMHTFGFMGGYPNGGYGALLGRSLYNSYYNLIYLEDTKWVTHSTRAVIIEFLAYNANYNVFHVVTLLVENSATGLIATSSNILTLRLLFVKQEFELMIAVEGAAFIIMTLIMLTKNLTIAKRRWSSYIASTWNLVDAAIITLSLLCIVIYYRRSYLVGQFLDQLERARNNQFLSYFHLVSMEHFLTVIGAALIFVATVRLWKFLRFIAAFRIVEKTFEMSAAFLVGLWFCHCILITMFTILGTNLFGSQLNTFHTFFTTFKTLTLLSMDLYEDFDFSHFVEVGGFLAMIYYSSFTFIMLMVYTMYVSLLVLCYSQSVTHFSYLHNSHAIAEYLNDECRYYNALIHRYIGNFRLEAGDDKEKRKVTPKSDEHRYANVVTVSERKLRAMSAVTQALIAKREGGERRIELIANLLYYVVIKDEVDDNKMLGFIDQQDDGPHIVTDYRLLQIEYAANYIIAAGTEEDSRIETFDRNNKERSRNPVNNQLNDILKALKLFNKIFKNISVTSKTLRCNCDCRKEWNYFIYSFKNKD